MYFLKLFFSLTFFFLITIAAERNEGLIIEVKRVSSVDHIKNHKVRLQLVN